MKTRLGYVSNSSTSSFVLIGTVIGIDEMQDAFDGFGENDEAYDFLEKKFGKELAVRGGLDDIGEDYYAVGYDVMLMKDDETVGEIKKKVLDILKRGGWKEDRIGKIEMLKDAGYDR